MNYRNEQECRYYGSDLNKWIHEACSKQMTAINMDLLLYKRSKKMMKIVESKHNGEEIPFAQSELLRILATWVKPIVDKAKLFNDFNVYIVEADYPYEDAEIIDMSTKKIYKLKDGYFKKWVEFDYTLSDIDLKDKPRKLFNETITEDQINFIFSEADQTEYLGDY